MPVDPDPVEAHAGTSMVRPEKCFKFGDVFADKAASVSHLHVSGVKRPWLCGQSVLLLACHHDLEGSILQWPL
jgi:hypothetical protein